MFNFLFGKKAKKAKQQEQQQQQKEEVKQEVREDYNFKLTVCNLDVSNDIYEPVSGDIDEALNKLRIAEQNFLVLSSRVPVNGFTYVQATGYVPSEMSVYAEAQVAKSNAGKPYYVNYGNQIDLKTLCDILNGFISGKQPDISDWNEMMRFDD